MPEPQNSQQVWITLTTRMGEDIANPSKKDVVNALEDLYQEGQSETADLDYEEHPNTWLQYGFDEGPIYVLDFYRGGLVLFSKYADADFNEAISEQQMRSAQYEAALRLSLWLLEGDFTS